MGQINVNKIDTPIMEQTKFEGDMYRWLPDMVDEINTSFDKVLNCINYLFDFGLASLSGSGAGPYTVAVTGMTTLGFANVTIVNSTNDVTVLSVVEGAGSFDVTFNADPGTANIVWQAFALPPI